MNSSNQRIKPDGGRGVFQGKMTGLTPLQIKPSAIIQGAVIAVTILSLSILYFDRLSRISHSLLEMAEAVDSIEDEVTSVELTKMERTLTKLDYTLDQRGEAAFHSGEGTIYHTLPNTGMEVGISYVTTHPASHGGYVDIETGEFDEDYEGPEIVVEMEFEDEVNMQALFDKLASDEQIAEREEELFEREVGLFPALHSRSFSTSQQTIMKLWHHFYRSILM